MTNITIAQTESVSVAIDVAITRHEVLIAAPDRKRLQRLTVLNQIDDFNRLITTASDYECPLCATFDATGNYHHTFAYRLANAGFEEMLVSSIASGSERLTGALLNRLTHHVHTLDMNGDSFSLKQSKKRKVPQK